MVLNLFIFQTVLEGKCVNDSEVFSLKAALYALSGIVVYLDTVSTAPSSVATSDQPNAIDRSTDSESLLEVSAEVIINFMLKILIFRLILVRFYL